MKNINCNTSSKKTNECNPPIKKNNQKWKKYTPSLPDRSYLDWYYCDPKSEELALRDVSRNKKDEPHYEDVTFNVCASCNQRYLNKAIKDGERYIFFFTRYAGKNKKLKNKKLKKRRQK